MTFSNRDNIYIHKLKIFTKNLDLYHSKYYKKMVFTGPSLYFHKKALLLRETNNYERFLESIYAALTSWGMHRMGKRGPKMNTFADFYKSIYNLKDKIILLNRKRLENLDKNTLISLREIFSNISIMQTGTILVGNSKVLAHLVPDLIPPIDREYTLNFLQGNPQIPIDKNKQADLFEDILNGGFFKVAKAKKFKIRAYKWKRSKKFDWDTSIPKIIDNLIIGAQQNKK